MVDEPPVRWSHLITAVFVHLLVLLPAATADAADNPQGSSRMALRPFLETGLFFGHQTDALMWAQGNARARGEFLYVEGGVDLEWKRPGDVPGHRIGFVVSIDMGGESGYRPALGLGPRITYSIWRGWALQAQAGLLGGRQGEEECSNSLGSEHYYFDGGWQARIALLYRNRLSAVLMWRALHYDAELYPLEYVGQPLPPWPPQRSSGTAHLLCLGVMLHGKYGAYASLGSFLCMAILTVVGSLAEGAQ